jgi:hypothetical protein
MSNTELDNNMNARRSFTHTKMEDIADMFSDPNNILIMHNGIAYDGPAAAKVLGIKVEAEIIDTLFLSWYLYPKMLRHGLAFWGEELGIKKPDIDDWENLSLAEYVHRCEEDVRIQTALWRQMWKHLLMLYGTAEGAWHAVRHLNFKAKCAALQEKSKWKLNVPAAEKLLVVFENKFSNAKADLEAVMPQVPVMKKKSKPKKPYKASGDLSKIGEAWYDFCVEHKIDFDFDGEISYQSGTKAPNAGSPAQIKDWLFSMGWTPQIFKFDRNKETGDIRQIPQVKNADTGDLCPDIERLIKIQPELQHLAEMSIVKHRMSVVAGFLKHVDEKGYVIAAVQGLTNTLRFKHKVCLNLPSLRKPYGKEIRGLLMARSEKFELCGSDMSSLEDRTKQHYMWEYDPEYVKEMQAPDFDPHLDMCFAANMVTKDDIKFYKEFDKENHTLEEDTRHSSLAVIRHAGKGTNYAATYGAGGATIARSAGVPEHVGDKLFNAYWKRNWSLVSIADACVVKQSRGLKWLWNPVAKLWVWLKAEKDRFSTLNQSTGTYCFDRWVFHILSRRPQLTGQFHDEVILELGVGNREKCTELLKWAVGMVNEELKLNRSLDCDVDFGRDYSEIH